VDLKRQAIGPIVLLARCYALEGGTPARGTLARLEEAAREGRLDRPVAEAAGEAFRFLLTLRLRRALARRDDPAAPPAGEVALEELTAIERSRLKDGLRAVKSLADAAEFHFRPGGG
jgi:CBS domain-containing protein